MFFNHDDHCHHIPFLLRCRRGGPVLPAVTPAAPPFVGSGAFTVRTALLKFGRCIIHQIPRMRSGKGNKKNSSGQQSWSTGIKDRPQRILIAVLYIPP